MTHAKKIPVAVKNLNRITISNIAELAGVSKATASLVLNGRAEEYRVAEETQKRVLAIAAEYHYQPSFHARALRSSRSHTVGLVIPDLTNYGFASIARQLEHLFRDAGLQLIIACSDEDPLQEQTVVNNLIQRQVDGLIIASSEMSDVQYKKIHATMPVLQLDRHIGQSTLPLVISDACDATARLVECVARQQPDEFYYFGGQLRLSPSRHRLAGYELGLKRAGVEPLPEWVQHRDFNANCSYDMMAELCERLGRAPRALFTSSFVMLEGVLHYLSHHPAMMEGLHLCSFDDHDLLDCMPLRIDSIAQDNTALAHHSFEMLKQLMEDKPLESNAAILPATIRWRHPGSLRLQPL